MLAYDKFPDGEWASFAGVTYTPLEDVLAQSDIVSLFPPLLPETHYLVGAESVREMEETTVIVNRSRGKLIDTRALIESLEKGKIRGVALDVYEEE